MSVLNLGAYLPESASFYIHRDDYGPERGRKLHSHDFAEIFLVEKGRGHHEINGLNYRLDEGMICIIRDRGEHSLASRRQMRILNIAFSAYMLKVFEREDFSLSSLPESRIAAVLDDEDRSRFISLSHALSRGSHEALDLEIFLLELLRMLRDVKRSEKGRIRSRENRHISWLGDFNRLLSDTEELGLNVGEMAERLGISREHFSREVMRIYGRTPVELIAEARIRYACHLLRMSSLRITEIAGNCGFSSPARFFTRFREITGETPGHFRNFRP